jgi:histidine phosphotransferase ChpT
MVPEEADMAAECDEAALSLAEAVVRRICHDLAGPIGTVAAALECLEEDPEAASLAAECAAAASARLRLLRGAWAGGVEALDAASLAALAPGLPGIERLHLNATAITMPLEGTAARLCLCLLLVAAGCMARGGEVLVGGSDAAIWVDLAGPAATWPDALLNDAAADAIMPRNLPAALCRRLARDAGWSLRIAGSRVVVERGVSL